MESHSVLGTIWASFGLMSYYIALIWINTLLGLFLTPLFLIPMTWLQDMMIGSKRQRRVAPAPARR